MSVQDRAVSIHPYFKVSEGKMDQFKSLCERFVARTGAEPQCLYYGFSFSGDEVFCREAYDSAEGALEHLANVGPLLSEAMEIAQITRLEIHGPEEELSKLKQQITDFSPTYFTLLYSVRR
jgi:quinol monooxygenase YgiN